MSKDKTSTTEPRGVIKVFVGYTLTTNPDLADFMPEFAPRKGTVDPKKQQEQIAAKQEEFKELRGRLPYLAQLQSVCLYSTRGPNGKAATTTFTAASTSGMPLCQRVRDWLVLTHPGAWPPGELFSETRVPKAIIVGFEPRLFLKVLGLDCAMRGFPLPPTLWYGNSDHRDIVEAVLPAQDCGPLADNLAFAKRVMGAGLRGEAAERYEKLFKDWTGPSKDAQLDVAIAMCWAASLGFIASPAEVA